MVSSAQKHRPGVREECALKLSDSPFTNGLKEKLKRARHRVKSKDLGKEAGQTREVEVFLPWEAAFASASVL